jgi:hypothetical protein
MLAGRPRQTGATWATGTGGRNIAPGLLLMGASDCV